MSPLQADMVDEIKGLAFLLASPPLLSFLSMGHHRAVEAPFDRKPLLQGSTASREVLR